MVFFCHIIYLLFDLTSVNDNVLGQVSHVNKGFIAHLTFVRPYVVVVTNVIGQLTGLHKPIQIKHITNVSKLLAVVQMKTNFAILLKRTFCHSDRTRMVFLQCAGGRERSRSWPG